MRKSAIKITLGLFLSALFFPACSKEKSGYMLVEGKVDGLKKGVLYLQHIPDTVLVTLDSLIIQGDGAFEFEIPLESPELFYLYLDKADQNDINDRLAFFGEPGRIEIQTRWDGFDTRARINGSASQSVFEEYKKVMSRFNTEHLTLLQARFGVQDSIYSQVLLDSLDRRIEQNTLRTYLYAVNFALNNKHSHVAPFIAVSEIPEVQERFLDTIYNALPDSVVAGTYGRKLKDLILSRKAELP